jgi:hypothetical protein
VGKALRAEVGAWFVRALRSRVVARVLLALVAALVALSLCVTSVRVVAADPKEPVLVYGPLGAAGAPTRLPRERRLDPTNAEWRPIVLALPWGRRVSFLAEPGRRSRPVRAWPWMPRRLVYPFDFEALAEVTVLPLGNFFDLFLAGGSVRLEVRDSVGAPVAVDTLRAVQALQLSAVRVDAPDSAATGRWASALRQRFGADSAQAAALAGRWARARWVRTRRGLQVGERLSLLLVSSRGDTVAADTLTIGPERRDVFVRRRP